MYPNIIKVQKLSNRWDPIIYLYYNKVSIQYDTKLLRYNKVSTQLEPSIIKVQ